MSLRTHLKSIAVVYRKYSNTPTSCILAPTQEAARSGAEEEGALSSPEMARKTLRHTQGTVISVVPKSPALLHTAQRSHTIGAAADTNVNESSDAASVHSSTAATGSGGEYDHAADVSQREQDSGPATKHAHTIRSTTKHNTDRGLVRERLHEYAAAAGFALREVALQQGRPVPLLST